MKMRLLRGDSLSGRVLVALPLLIAFFLLASGPAEARNCPRQEKNHIRQLEKRLVRCRGNEICEVDARVRCHSRLNRSSCDTTVCGLMTPGDDEEVCVFQTAEQVVPKIDTLLGDLTEVLNNGDDGVPPGVWSMVATTENLDPLDDVYSGTVKLGEDACLGLGGAAACLPGFCLDLKAEVTVSNLQGLADLQFNDVAVQSVTTEDLSAFKIGGPWAGRINSGAIPDQDGPWNTPHDTVILPVADPRSSIIVDLGEVFPLCSLTSGCPPALFQGSAAAAYTVEYSLTGSDWSTLFDVPAVNPCTCLKTRQIDDFPEVEARYIRIYATSGAGEYSVSYLGLVGINHEGAMVRINADRPAVGPQPLVVTSLRAPEGASDKDARVTRLPGTGAGSAVTVDLGRIVDLDGPGDLYVSGDDHYVVDYSTNGFVWRDAADVPPPNTGATSKIVKRGLPTGLRENVRFVRIYPRDSQGTSSDGVYAVAGLVVTFLSPTGQFIFNDPLDAVLPATATGPEAVFTNTDRADDGTSWDSEHYAYVLSSLERVTVDLGKAAGRGIDRVRVQASGNDDYVVLISDDFITWKHLWTATAQTSKDHLITRDSGNTLVDPATGEPFVGRYVQAYADGGDNENSIAELDIFNNVLKRGCPFDPEANENSDGGNASCGFSGEADGAAFFQNCEGGSSKCLTVDAKANLTYICSFDDVKLPVANITCNAGSPSGTARANFCAVSCGDPKSSDPRGAAMTYMQVDHLDMAVDGLTCVVDDLDLWDVDAGLTYFEQDIVDALEPTVKKVLNDVLKDETPFPPQGPGGICSE
jgi:hypothetical protein